MRAHITIGNITRIMVDILGILTVIGAIPKVVVTFIVFAGPGTMGSGFGFVDKSQSDALVKS